MQVFQYKLQKILKIKQQLKKVYNKNVFYHNEKKNHPFESVSEILYNSSKGPGHAEHYSHDEINKTITKVNESTMRNNRYSSLSKLRHFTNHNYAFVSTSKIKKLTNQENLNLETEIEN